MPADSTRNTLARQWELLKLLPARGTGKTAWDLAQALNQAGFKVGKRQVERDLQTLRESFPLDCNDASPPYGWRWVTGASAGLPGLSLSEAMSLIVVKETLAPLLPAPLLDNLAALFGEAERKLASLACIADKVAWTDKVRVAPATLALRPPTLATGILETLQDALAHDRQVAADYTRRDRQAPRTMSLNPLALVQSGPVTYLVAIGEGYDEARLFAVHRFSRVERLNRSCRRPTGFDLDALIGAGLLGFGKLRQIRLEARITEPLRLILAETPLSGDQELLPGEDGRHALRATVADSELLRRWLLGQGADIEVVEPTHLRADILTALRSALVNYDN